MAAAAAVVVLGGVAGGSVVGRLSSSGLHDPASQSWRAEMALRRASGHDPDAELLVLVRLPGVRAAHATRIELARLTRLLERLGVAPVQTPFRSAALWSRDGHSALLVAQGVGDAAASRVMRALAGDRRVELGGGPILARQVNAIIAADLRRAELIALPLLLLLSFWVFRGLVAALLPPLVGVIAIAAALAGLWLVSRVATLSIYALNLVTGLGLGLAIDWSLFVLSRYREEIARARPGPLALERTLATAGRTVLFSAATMAAALASLLVFPERFLYSMGIGGILIALTGAAAALIALPALLGLLGSRVHSLAPARLRRASARAARPAESGFWFRLALGVMRRPLPVALATAALLLLLGTPFLGIRFASFQPSALPTSSSARQVDSAVRSRFGSALAPALYVIVRAANKDASAVAAYAARIRALPTSPDVAAPTLVAPATWKIDAATPATTSSLRDQRLVHEIRALRPPFPTLVGGESATLVDLKASIASHLPAAIAIVVATTLILLFLMTGSVVLPLKALIFNALTISAVFGALVWTFQEGRLQRLLGYTSQHAIDTTQPVLIAVIAFALTTDYGVFVLTRIKEARDAGANDTTAIAIGLERTGRIVTAAALLFLTAIAAFATSRIITIKEVGLGTGLAVALDATIVRMLLLPALMRLLGRWNWWAPSLLTKLHQRANRP